MTDHLSNADQLQPLLAAMLDDRLTDGQIADLRHLLRGDPTARRQYVRQLTTHVMLQWLNAPPDGEEDSEFVEQEPGASVHPSSFLPYPSSIPPIIIDPSPTLHAPLFTLHSPVGSFVFSHLVAAVILGIGLLAGLAWRISLQPADNGGIVGIDRRQESPPTIGRITALADCRWKQWRVESGEWRANPEIPKSRNPQISVSLGDRFALSSGFMEITYDTGAKVLLEAPCTYGIESARGGYLAVGKLTAKVESPESRDQSQTKKREHSRLSTHDSGLFAVRTPTAIVTDLGTEFGVEVEESGTTRSCVFQGKIELRSQENSQGLTAPGASPSDHVVQLTAGESARVERGRNRAIAITREPGQPGKYVRRIPSSFIPHPSSLGNGLSTLNSRLSYRLTDLGTLGGKTSRAFDINARGEVVGDAAIVGGAMHAFLYTDGKMKDISALHEGNSCAYGINSVGQVVGGMSDEGNRRAFLYADGETKNIGNLGGLDTRAYAINDAGAVVGCSQNADGVRRAFLYTDARGMKDLGTLGGPKAMSWAHGINATGLVVGWAENRDGQMRAFLYRDGHGMKDLGTFGGRRSGAFRTNAAGQVLGLSFADDGAGQVFLYDSKTGAKNRWTLDGRPNLAVDLNNVGQMVVGVVDCDAAHPGAFLYEEGRWIDLNSLVERFTGWTLLAATAINDSGQIVGNGIAPDSSMRAFLLTPVKKGLGARGKGQGIERLTN